MGNDTAKADESNIIDQLQIKKSGDLPLPKQQLIDIIAVGGAAANRNVFLLAREKQRLQEQ